jgi:hypothetical protein
LNPTISALAQQGIAEEKRATNWYPALVAPGESLLESDLIALVMK